MRHYDTECVKVCSYSQYSAATSGTGTGTRTARKRGKKFVSKKMDFSAQSREVRRMSSNYLYRRYSTVARIIHAYPILLVNTRVCFALFFNSSVSRA